MKKIVTFLIVIIALGLSCNSLVVVKYPDVQLVQRNGPLLIMKPEISMHEAQIERCEALFNRKADSMLRKKPQPIALPNSFPIHLK